MADSAGMRVTGTALHDAWWAKADPPVEQVADGLWSIPVPVPDLPIRCTLSYLFQGTDGAALVVDPGWDTDAGWDALVAGWSAWETTGGLTGSRGWEQVRGLLTGRPSPKPPHTPTDPVDGGRLAESLDGDGLLRYAVLG